MSESPLLELDVTGMTCGGCASSVKKALQQVDAAARIEVDLAGRRVTIVGSMSVEQAVGAIEAAGFGATPRRPA